MLHASEKPRALRDVNPSMPSSPELEALIFKALEKDRKKRFATARELARALEEIEPSLDDQTGAPPPLPTGVRGDGRADEGGDADGAEQQRDAESAARRFATHRRC